MGLGKIARGAGKVGLLIEGIAYIVAAGRALVKAVKGDPDDTEGRSNRQDRGGDITTARDSQGGPSASTGANVAPEPSPP